MCVLIEYIVYRCENVFSLPPYGTGVESREFFVGINCLCCYLLVYVKERTYQSRNQAVHLPETLSRSLEYRNCCSIVWPIQLQ